MLQPLRSRAGFMNALRSVSELSLLRKLGNQPNPVKLVLDALDTLNPQNIIRVNIDNRPGTLNLNNVLPLINFSLGTSFDMTDITFIAKNPDLKAWILTLNGSPADILRQFNSILGIKRSPQDNQSINLILEHAQPALGELEPNDFCELCSNDNKLQMVDKLSNALLDPSHVSEFLGSDKTWGHNNTGFQYTHPTAGSKLTKLILQLAHHIDQETLTSLERTTSCMATLRTGYTSPLPSQAYTNICRNIHTQNRLKRKIEQRYEWDYRTYRKDITGPKMVFSAWIKRYASPNDKLTYKDLTSTLKDLTRQRDPLVNSIEAFKKNWREKITEAEDMYNHNIRTLIYEAMAQSGILVEKTRTFGPPHLSVKKGYTPNALITACAHFKTGLLLMTKALQLSILETELSVDLAQLSGLPQPPSADTKNSDKGVSEYKELDPDVLIAEAATFSRCVQTSPPQPPTHFSELTRVPTIRRKSRIMTL